MSSYNHTNPKSRRRSRRYSEGNNALAAAAVDIRIGSRRAHNQFTSLRVTGPRDANQFQRLVDNSVKTNPEDCLFMSVLISRLVSISRWPQTDLSTATGLGYTMCLRPSLTTSNQNRRWQIVKHNTVVLPFNFLRKAIGELKQYHGHLLWTKWMFPRYTIGHSAWHLLVI